MFKIIVQINTSSVLNDVTENRRSPCRVQSKARQRRRSSRPGRGGGGAQGQGEGAERKVRERSVGGAQGPKEERGRGSRPDRGVGVEFKAGKRRGGGALLGEDGDDVIALGRSHPLPCVLLTVNLVLHEEMALLLQADAAVRAGVAVGVTELVPQLHQHAPEHKTVPRHNGPERRRGPGSERPSRRL